MADHTGPRRRLDQLFFLDAITSVIFGVLSLIAPHRAVSALSEGGYSHSTHEALRLYGCLRIAMGWVVLHARRVDDGRFRRSVCEALFVCYVLQAMAVIRAQFTDRHTLVNWVAIIVLTALGASYGRFRFGSGGTMIKVYELPNASSKSAR
eukprot:CAMPEP_0195529788 /NCGR_PEP_ID=MMETSP0794_2-20130614/32432_1 /TAXON_ID=515487 /ORGANISM="Stephanopyxis turris, Strain CCMP 815" /LENGTH=150 /DNA_ID=CAMNT_0040661147 /DNA_START=167 /DNA_END=619 /DNA_ORIENTATION=-